MLANTFRHFNISTNTATRATTFSRSSISRPQQRALITTITTSKINARVRPCHRLPQSGSVHPMIFSRHQSSVSFPFLSSASASHKTWSNTTTTAASPSSTEISFTSLYNHSRKLSSTSCRSSQSSPPSSPPNSKSSTSSNQQNYKTLTMNGCANFSENDEIDQLLLRNSAWSDRLHTDRPDLFKALATTQKPQILWFGCSDSRVPETSLLDLLPGEVFVHRNIANVLPYNDLSSLSVLQYAVEVLKVR